MLFYFLGEQHYREYRNRGASLDCQNSRAGGRPLGSPRIGGHPLNPSLTAGGRPLDFPDPRVRGHPLNPSLMRPSLRSREQDAVFPQTWNLTTGGCLLDTGSLSRRPCPLGFRTLEFEAVPSDQWCRGPHSRNLNPGAWRPFSWP